jgi:hypothetical protein
MEFFRAPGSPFHDEGGPRTRHGKGVKSAGGKGSEERRRRRRRRRLHEGVVEVEFRSREAFRLGGQCEVRLLVRECRRWWRRWRLLCVLGSPWSCPCVFEGGEGKIVGRRRGGLEHISHPTFQVVAFVFYRGIIPGEGAVNSTLLPPLLGRVSPLPLQIGAPSPLAGSPAPRSPLAPPLVGLGSAETVAATDEAAEAAAGGQDSEDSDEQDADRRHAVLGPHGLRHPPQEPQ